MFKKINKICLLLFLLTISLASVKAETLPIEKYVVLNEHDPDNVYVPVNFYVGVFETDKGNKIARTLLKFDINEVLDKKISDAVLYLGVSLEKEGTTKDVQVLEVHKVLEDWGSATWNDRPSYGRAIDSVAITGDGTYRLDITDLVQDWIIDPRENFGILLKAEDEDNINYKEFTRGSSIEVNVIGKLTECDRKKSSCKSICDRD